MEIVSLLLFYAVDQLLNWPVLYQSFGFQEPTAYIGLFLIGALLGPLSYFVQPLGAALSRRFERESDDFSSELIQTPEPLCNALRRLATDNLENLNPHPLYARFYYSHPPLIERITRLQSKPNDRR
jgi:STE24 endopeptidase